jgi:hypothetical protein
MSDMFKKALTLIVGDDQAQGSRPFKELTERDLIRLESEIGRELFGPIPAGHRREFFCLDDHTWIWHEEWVDQNNKRRMMTTRYESHPSGILKVQEGQPYKFVTGQELKNLAVATRLYYEQVMRGVYKRDPATGKKLVPMSEQMLDYEESA